MKHTEKNDTKAIEITPRKDVPHTSKIEWCANYGCAFNGAFKAGKGRCTASSGYCYGYMPLEQNTRQPAAD